MRKETVYMYGKHALEEALRSTPGLVQKAYVSGNMSEELAAAMRAARIPVGRFDDRTPPGGIDKHANHQGYIAEVRLDRLMRPYDEFIQGLAVTPDAGLVLLGELQDPQNVGAIIRTAAAFGIKGVLMPERNQAPVTAAVVKVSAGMAFHVPLVSIGNVNATIKDLKERGFWVYGLDMEAKQSIVTEKFDAPAVFVLGNEEKGIRMKTLEHCDVPLRVPMNPGCESLNVAASAAVALYAWSAKHPGALK